MGRPVVTPLGICAWLCVLLACALGAAGCGGATAAAGNAPSAGPPQHGGTIVLGIDQEPPCVNTMIACGNMATAQMLTGPLFDPFINVDEKGNRIPVMATEIPSTANGGVSTVGGKMVVKMGIVPAAHWSDNVPVTCDDFKFTWKTVMDDRWTIVSRLGWDQIDSVDCTDEHTIVTTFKKPYAPYLNVIGSSPLPKHELDGKDFNKYWNDRVTVVNGPFAFGSWQRGVQFSLVRNTNYWRKGNNDLPYLQQINYHFISDTNTLKIQLRTGEVDWILPPPDTSTIDELKTFPRAKFQSMPGGYWEQFAFNLSAPPMDDVHVRRAIAYSINRQQITDIVLRKQTTPLNSSLLPAAKDYYEPTWGVYTYDPAKAKQELEAAGYKRTGQFYTKNGKTLSFVFKSTAGNALRMKVAQLLQQSFKNAGIQMDISLEDPGVFFGQTLLQGAFQGAVFAWSSGVDPTQTSLFACDQIPTKKNQYSGQNNYRYCNPEATKLMYAADVAPDVASRAKLTKQVERLMAADVPFLPLYQRPDTVAYNANLQGIVDNPLGGQFFNTSDWWVSKQ